MEPAIDLRAEHARLVRSKIKSAAVECFRENGYRATTIRQIARKAGTTHTTFYQYFKGKGELVVELMCMQGGISNGEIIYFKVAFKPTATIGVRHPSSKLPFFASLKC